MFHSFCFIFQWFSFIFCFFLLSLHYSMIILKFPIVFLSFSNGFLSLSSQHRFSIHLFSFFSMVLFYVPLVWPISDLHDFLFRFLSCASSRRDEAQPSQKHRFLWCPSFSKSFVSICFPLFCFIVPYLFQYSSCLLIFLHVLVGFLVLHIPLFLSFIVHCFFLHFPLVFRPFPKKKKLNHRWEHHRGDFDPYDFFSREVYIKLIEYVFNWCEAAFSWYHCQAANLADYHGLRYKIPDLAQMARNDRGRGETTDGALPTLTTNSGKLYHKEFCFFVSWNRWNWQFFCFSGPPNGPHQVS